MATKLIITPLIQHQLLQPVTQQLLQYPAVGGAADAGGVTFSNAVTRFSDDNANNNVQDALNYLANNFFVATEAPTANTTNLAEGDLFYDTDDNQLKIYRETSTGTFEFVPIMIGNSSADSDTVDAGSF